MVLVVCQLKLKIAIVFYIEIRFYSHIQSSTLFHRHLWNHKINIVFAKNLIYRHLLNSVAGKTVKIYVLKAEIQFSLILSKWL